MFDFILSLFENCSPSEAPLAPLEMTAPPRPESPPWYFKVFAPEPPETVFTVAHSKLSIIQKCLLTDPISGPFFMCTIDLQQFVLFYYSEIVDEIAESKDTFKEIVSLAITNKCSVNDVSCLIDLPHKLDLTELLGLAAKSGNVPAVEYLVSHCISKELEVYPFDYESFSPEVFSVFKTYLASVHISDSSKDFYCKIFADKETETEPEPEQETEPEFREILDEEALMERIQNLELLMTNFGIPIFTAVPRTSE